MIRNEAANDNNNYDNTAYITLMDMSTQTCEMDIEKFLNNSEQIAHKCGQREAGKKKVHLV